MPALAQALQTESLRRTVSRQSSFEYWLSREKPVGASGVDGEGEAVESEERDSQQGDAHQQITTRKLRCLLLLELFERNLFAVLCQGSPPMSDDMQSVRIPCRPLAESGPRAESRSLATTGGP